MFCCKIKRAYFTRWCSNWARQKLPPSPKQQNRCTSKGITQILLRTATWLWTLPTASPPPSLFLRQHCDSSTMSSLLWRRFSNSFALSELHFFFFYTRGKYLHIQDVCLFGFFLQLHPMIPSSHKITYYFYLYLYVIVCVFSYSNQKCRPPKKLSTRFCALRDSEPKLILCQVWDKVLRDFFLPPPKLHMTLQFYQGFYLLENCVKLPFCLTTFFNIT